MQFILAAKATVPVWTEDKSRPYGPSSAMLATPAMLSRPPGFKMSNLTSKLEGHSSSLAPFPLRSATAAVVLVRICCSDKMAARAWAGRPSAASAEVGRCELVARKRISRAFFSEWVSHQTMLQSIFPQLCRSSILKHLKQHLFQYCRI